MQSPIIHLNIPATDLQQSQRFYGAIFGWTFTPNTDSYVLFDDGGHGGGLSLDTRVAPGAGVLLFIQAADLEQTLAAVRAHGGTVVKEPAPTGGGGMYAVFTDPAGNRMGLATPH